MKKCSFYALSRAIFALVFFFLLATYVQAQTFLGATGDGLWSNADNWLDGQKPDGMFSEVTISADVLVDENVSIGTLNNYGDFSLTVLADKMLMVNVAINWGDNDIILEDKAELVYSEPVRVLIKKSINAYNEDSHLWDLIASPVRENVVPSMGNGFITDPETSYVLYSFDENIADWVNYKETPFALENGQSYLYANALDTTLLFEGTTEGYTAECNLSYHAENGVYAGCNFIGNPLPCNAFLNRSFYVLSEKGNSLLPVANSTTSSIASCTGIIVNSEGVEDTGLWFSYMPFFQYLGYQGYIELTVAKSEAPSLVLDQALLSFNPADNLGEVTIFQGQPSLYFSKESKNYSILSVDSVEVQALKFKPEENGSYLLHIEPKGRTVEYMHLIDNITGQNVDLLANPDYTFAASANDYVSRFKLVFDPHYSVNAFENQKFAYYVDGKIHLYNIETQGIASLQVVDMTGRTVWSENINGRDGVHTVSTRLNSGVYVLRLISPDTVWTQKMVID